MLSRSQMLTWAILGPYRLYLPFKGGNCPSSKVLLPHKNCGPNVAKPADFSKKAGILDDDLNSWVSQHCQLVQNIFRTLCEHTVCGPSDPRVQWDWPPGCWWALRLKSTSCPDKAEAKQTSIRVLIPISFFPGLQFPHPYNVDNDPYFSSCSENWDYAYHVTSMAPITEDIFRKVPSEDDASD